MGEIRTFNFKCNFLAKNGMSLSPNWYILKIWVWITVFWRKIKKKLTFLPSRPVFLRTSKIYLSSHFWTPDPKIGHFGTLLNETFPTSTKTCMLDQKKPILWHPEVSPIFLEIEIFSKLVWTPRRKLAIIHVFFAFGSCKR